MMTSCGVFVLKNHIQVAQRQVAPLYPGKDVFQGVERRERFRQAGVLRT